ncbi:hypothetical protein SDJN03_23073, partial [Cucurbita argyrosperma subsp. sororia]
MIVGTPPLIDISFSATAPCTAAPNRSSLSAFSRRIDAAPFHIRFSHAAVDIALPPPAFFSKVFIIKDDEEDRKEGKCVWETKTFPGRQQK